MKKLYVASITPFDGNNQINDSAMRQLWDRILQRGPMVFLLEEAPGNASCCQGKSGYIPLNWLANIRIGQRCSPMWELLARKRPYSMPEKQKKWEYRTSQQLRHFTWLSDKEIAGYYYDIAEAVDMPVLYYNIPSSTHRELNPSQPDWQPS